MNYYRRYLGDYMRDTMHLSIMEHGTYTLLLDAQYATEKALPSAYEALYRLCRAMTKAEQEAVRSIADQFFPLDEDGGRWNPRAKREVAIAQSTIEKQRKSGVESAAKRWSTDGSTHAPTIQPPTTNHQPPSSNPQPPSTNHQPEVKDTARKRAAVRPESVSEKVWNDFLLVRKAKRAPLTETAWAGIQSEADKAGITLQNALEMCCKRGWQAFEAAWLKNGKGHSNADEIAKAKAKLFGTERDITDEASRV